MASIDDRIAELVGLTESAGQGLPRFSLQRHATSDATGKVHAEQLAFMRDQRHRVHVMCARQSGKSQGDDGILMDAGLFRPYSTNVILGLNGPHIRTQNWEPIWKRMFDKFSGLDSDWRNEARMVTTFPNGSRVIMSGTDDSKHLKNVLGGRIDNGVFIVDECFPSGVIVGTGGGSGWPIERTQVGDLVACVKRETGEVEYRKVVKVFKRKVSGPMVRLKIGGVVLPCTPNHPVFVRGRGYVPAMAVQAGDECRTLTDPRRDFAEWVTVSDASYFATADETPVYNLEVEESHTYFANGVLVHNCQDQPGLDELLDSILPPMMGVNARLILSGVFPDAPVGRFWRESGWVERDGQWTQEPSRGWSRHNWGRLANVHTPDSWESMQRYLHDTGLTINDQQIIRDWMGKPAFDPNVTAYRYDRARNGYTPQMPDWLRMVYAQQKDDRGRDLKYAHEMRPDKDGVLYGMMAAEPLFGVQIFSLALDPGATSDAASIQGFGWGPEFRGAQHLFDWTTQRKSHVSTGDMFAVLGLAYKAFLRWGEAMNPRYDAGSSQNTIDNLQNDYGLPLVLAAKKTDLIGQVNRFNDLMTEAKLKVMQGSAMEQDLLRARWNKAALERHQREWDRSHHPNASEGGRYSIQDYFEAAIPKQTGPGGDYGYQDPVDKSRPTVSYNQITGTGEAYGGGNADGGGGNGSGGGGYGGPWTP